VPRAVFRGAWTVERRTPPVLYLAVGALVIVLLALIVPTLARFAHEIRPREKSDPTTKREAALRIAAAGRSTDRGSLTPPHPALGGAPRGRDVPTAP
jgi:hypothetical protein